MVTIQDAVQYVNGVACTTQKVWCKSTDVKPTEGIGNGSQLREMDTGKDYAFDAENGEWLEQPSEGGGGGGGGGSSTLSGLTDVDISNPTDGQTLVYNSTSGKWENGAGGGGGLVVPFGEIGGNPTLMAPAGDIFTAYMSGVDVVITLNIDGYGLVEAKRLSVVGVAGDESKKFVIEPSSTYSGIIPSGVYEAGSDADYPTIPR